MKRLRLELFLVLPLAWMSGVVGAQGLTTTSGTMDEPALLGSYVTEPFTIEELAVLGFDKDDLCGNTGTFNMKPAARRLEPRQLSPAGLHPL